MKKEAFFKKYSLTQNQFKGLEKIGGDLDLRSLTSLPEGFNPTVGVSLYLSSLTSLPEGFNPTVGGYLDLRSLTRLPEGFNPTVGGSLDLSSLTSLPEGFNPTVGGSLYLKNKSIYVGTPISKINKNLFWKKNETEYALIDGIFCEIINRKKNEDIHILSCSLIGKNKAIFVATDGVFYAHGHTLREAVSDLKYKVEAEQMKNKPIYPDTIITVEHYRAITGACKAGCLMWIDSNGMSGISEIRADKLLPILKKSNAYGYDEFLKNCTFVKE